MAGFLSAGCQARSTCMPWIKALGLSALDWSDAVGIYRLNTGINISQHQSNGVGRRDWLQKVIKIIDSEGRQLTASERQLFGLME